MESDNIISMLQQAVKQKNNSISTYKKYIESAENGEIRQILESTLEKERNHRELLRHIQESVRKGVYGSDLPGSSDQATEPFSENLNRLIQSKAFQTHYKNQFSNIYGSIVGHPGKRISFNCPMRSK